MALKDWIKTSSEKKLIVFEKRTIKLVIMKHPLNTHWFVSIDSDHFSLPKYFKSKVLALRFANSYMRSH